MQNIRGKFTFFGVVACSTYLLLTHIYLTHTLINSYIVHFSRADAPIIGHMLEYCSNVEHTSDTYNEDGHCRGEATAKVLPQRMKWEIPEPVRIKYRLLYLN